LPSSGDGLVITIVFIMLPFEENLILVLMVLYASAIWDFGFSNVAILSFPN
jgi:hypothetical protein